MIVPVLGLETTEYTRLVALLCSIYKLLQPIHLGIMSRPDKKLRILPSHVQPLLLRLKVVERGLIFVDSLLIVLNHLRYLLTDCIRQDHFGAKTMDFIELTTETGQFSHNLNKITLLMSVLVIYLLFLFELLVEFLAKCDVFFESVGIFYLLLLDDSTADQFVYGLTLETQLLLNQTYADRFASQLFDG